MNDEKDHSLDPPEIIANDSAAPAGDDSFFAGESDSNGQELPQQIEVARNGLPAPRDPARPTAAADSDEDPPGWPAF
jgi:hypothetical protein